MPGFYERKTSRAAYWCQRLALVCIPYFAITILLHRFGKVTTPQVFWLVAFGLLMLIASLAFAARAIFDLWDRGDRGGGALFAGTLLSLAMLAPFVWYGWLAVRHPVMNDISTNTASPPPFVEAVRVREAGREGGMNPLITYDRIYSDLMILSYPEVASRRYNSGAARVYSAVRALIADRDWKVIATRGLSDTGKDTTAEPPESSEGETAGPSEGENADAAEAPIIADSSRDVEIEAVASSLVFGFKSDVAIAIIPEAESTLVDMRSASRFGAHDFGANAAQIKKFLADLDKALIGIAGEG